MLSYLPTPLSFKIKEKKEPFRSLLKSKKKINKREEKFQKLKGIKIEVIKIYKMSQRYKKDNTLWPNAYAARG